MIYRFEDNELRCPETEFDYKFLYDLRADPEVFNNLLSYMPTTYKQHVEYLDKINKEPNNKVFIFTINYANIGVVRINNIDYRNGTCEVGGDITKQYRSRGYSKHMYNTIFEFCKTQLNIRKLYLHVLDYNEVAQIVYEKMGFKKVGTMEKHVFKNGSFRDIIIMERFLS